MVFRNIQSNFVEKYDTFPLSAPNAGLIKSTYNLIYQTPAHCEYGNDERIKEVKMYPPYKELLFISTLLLMHVSFCIANIKLN